MLFFCVRFFAACITAREGCTLKLRDLTRVSTAGQLHHLLSKKRTRNENVELGALLESNLALARRLVTLVAGSADASLVKMFSPIFCLLSSSLRAQMIESFKPFKSREFLFFVSSLPAKGLRYLIRALDKMSSVDDTRFCLGKLVVSGNPEWPGVIGEAFSDKDLDRLRAREPICSEQSEEFTSLQAITYMIGSLLSASVILLPVCGRNPRPEYNLAGFKLTEIRPHETLVMNGEKSQNHWLPWVFQTEEGVEKALHLLEFLVGSLSLCDQGNELLNRIGDDAERMLVEISERWEAIKKGVHRWVLPDGQMKLRFGGDFVFCGLMVTELHPGKKVPEMTVRIVQNRFGYLKFKDRPLDENGLFKDMDLGKQVGLLELGINHKVVCWLADYALRPSNYKPKNGEGKSLDPIKVAFGEGKLPAGFHLPEYMNLPDKIKQNGKPYEASGDAKKRAEALGWAEPTDGQTFRMSGDPLKEGLGLPEPLDIVYDV